MRRPAGPLTGAPPTIGLTPTTRRARRASASTMPGTARIGPTEVTGFDGHTTTRSASASASSTPGAGRAPAAPVVLDGDDVAERLVAHEVLLEGQRAPRGSGRSVRTGSSLIGRMRAATPKPRGEPRGHRRQRLALAQRRACGSRCVARSRSPRLNHVGAAERGHRLQAVERLVRAAPAARDVEQAGQRVGHGVEVGRDVQPPDLGVVAGVADDGEVARGRDRPARPRSSLAAPVPPASAVTRTRERGSAFGRLRAASTARCRRARRRGRRRGGRPARAAARPRARG